MRSTVESKVQVRWWVVAFAIVASWVLTCFGPTAAEGQVIGTDSATSRQLSEYYERPTTRVVCLATHWASDSVLVIDSITTITQEPPCPPGTNGIAAKAPRGLKEIHALHAGWEILAGHSEFVVVCFIHGARVVKFQDGSAFPVPSMWCAYQQERR